MMSSISSISVVPGSGDITFSSDTTSSSSSPVSSSSSQITELLQQLSFDNSGSGSKVYSKKEDYTFYFRTLVSGSGIQISQSADFITVSIDPATLEQISNPKLTGIEFVDSGHINFSSSYDQKEKGSIVGTVTKNEDNFTVDVVVNTTTFSVPATLDTDNSLYAASTKYVQNNLVSYLKTKDLDSKIDSYFSNGFNLQGSMIASGSLTTDNKNIKSDGLGNLTSKSNILTSTNYASLPTSPTTGQILFCSDVYSSLRTADSHDVGILVVWNGKKWTDLIGNPILQ